ncbi:MAG: hypothetical protein LC793_16415 [Thermomicrobia bacterium]|nr:hypothetical protein [Thermomicrobia bacterium]MCA1722902.1 hypothetical protein [Thermomicrobia bacterium]
MVRVAFDTLYTGTTTDDKTGDITAQQQRFLEVCKEAGVTTVDRHAPVSAFAEGELLVRLIDRLNSARVPYAVEEQSHRAEDDGMPA